MSTTASRTKACSEPPRLWWTAFKTDWGWAAGVRSAAGLTRLSVPKRTAAAAARAVATAGARRDTREFVGVEAQVRAYFAGEPVAFTVDVDLQGLPPFFATVLGVARQIPYGETLTYGELARRVDRPGAARAVGQAMARNPVLIVVPCHRVVATTGLGGFSAPEGLALKRKLLAWEQRGLGVPTLRDRRGSPGIHPAPPRP